MDTIIRVASPTDLSFLAAHDRHISPAELDNSIRLGRILIIEGRSPACGGSPTGTGEPIGWLRWSLFWDNTPFMNLLYLLDGHRMQGHGRTLVHHWEQQMREQGYTTVLTSTQANEPAQHFYRHLGYRDIGGFLMDGEPYELIIQKTL